MYFVGDGVYTYPVGYEFLGQTHVYVKLLEMAASHEGDWEECSDWTHIYEEIEHGRKMGYKQFRKNVCTRQHTGSFIYVRNCHQTHMVVHMDKYGTIIRRRKPHPAKQGVRLRMYAQLFVMSMLVAVNTDTLTGRFLGFPQRKINGIIQKWRKRIRIVSNNIVFKNQTVKEFVSEVTRSVPFVDTEGF